MNRYKFASNDTLKKVNWAYREAVDLLVKEYQVFVHPSQDLDLAPLVENSQIL